MYLIIILYNKLMLIQKKDIIMHYYNTAIRKGHEKDDYMCSRGIRRYRHPLYLSPYSHPTKSMPPSTVTGRAATFLTSHCMVVRCDVTSERGRDEQPSAIAMKGSTWSGR